MVSSRSRRRVWVALCGIIRTKRRTIDMPVIEKMVYPKRNRVSFEVPREYSRFVCKVIVIPVEEGKPKCDYSRFSGRIKWKGGDPVAYQRSIRDEW